MPIHEYTCTKCDYRFEELVRAADADKQACPECGGKARRELSVFSAAAAGPSAADIPPSCQSCGMDPMSCPSRM
jgi:putative FmdB family regulatory protein